MVTMNELHASKKMYRTNFSQLTEENRAIRVSEIAKKEIDYLRTKSIAKILPSGKPVEFSPLEYERYLHQRMEELGMILTQNQNYTNFLANEKNFNTKEITFFRTIEKIFRESSEWSESRKTLNKLFDRIYYDGVVNSEGEYMHESQNTFLASTVVGDIASTIEESGNYILNSILDLVGNFTESNITDRYQNVIDSDIKLKGKKTKFHERTEQVAHGLGKLPTDFKRTVKRSDSDKQILAAKKEITANIAEYQYILGLAKKWGFIK